MIQLEAIYFTGYGTKIPNNIKIINSNDQTLQLFIGCLVQFYLFLILNFGHW